MTEKPILFSGEMLEQQWKPVVGFEGKYEVSPVGLIRSLSRYRPDYYLRVMKPWTQNKGYKYLTLIDKNNRRHAVGIHRAVLDAFVGPCPDGMQCAHYDGDPSNNRVDNLRWATSKDNHRDRRRHGRIPVGEACGSAKLDASAVKTIKKLKKTGLSSYELGHLACVGLDAIEAIWEGKTWKHVSEV